MSAPTREELTSQTLKQLQALAKSQARKGFWKLCKKDLVELLLTAPTAEPSSTNPSRAAPARREDDEGSKERRKGARQQHGFEYEKSLQAKFGWIKLGYTEPVDLLTGKKNPVSAKSHKKTGELCLGDYRRNKRIKQDFLLCVETRQNNIKTEKYYWVDHRLWIQFFEFDHDAAMMTEWGLITNLHADDQRSKECQKKYKQLWGLQRLVQLRFKRDHKDQKRIQCAVPKRHLDEFLSHFTPIDPQTV
jgi:hypothetical protein